MDKDAKNVNAIQEKYKKERKEMLSYYRDDLKMEQNKLPKRPLNNVLDRKITAMIEKEITFAKLKERRERIWREHHQE